MIGLVNVIVISTASPLNDPSLPAPALMPFTTVLSTLKLVLRTVAEIASIPADLARVAISISTSDGEFWREGTRCDGLRPRFRALFKFGKMLGPLGSSSAISAGGTGHGFIKDIELPHATRQPLFRRARLIRL